MAKKKEKKTPDIDNVESALNKSEIFIERNQKPIYIGLGIVVFVVALILAFHNLYQKPREIAAENAMYRAQEYFAVDSFKIAVEGDGTQVMGFKEIASQYGMTPSGDLAKAYTGICYYKLGKYEDAIKYLSKYEGKETYFKTTVTGLTGDCYAEMGNNNKAQEFYQKAIADKNDLAPVYLKKSGILYESTNNPAEAEKMYQRIKDDYPTSGEAYDIDKYLARVQK